MIKFAICTWTLSIRYWILVIRPFLWNLFNDPAKSSVLCLPSSRYITFTSSLNIFTSAAAFSSAVSPATIRTAVRSGG